MAKYPFVAVIRVYFLFLLYPIPLSIEIPIIRDHCRIEMTIDQIIYRLRLRRLDASKLKIPSSLLPPALGSLDRNSPHAASLINLRKVREIAAAAAAAASNASNGTNTQLDQAIQRLARSNLQAIPSPNTADTIDADQPT
jgi:hypothetical protein